MEALPQVEVGNCKDEIRVLSFDQIKKRDSRGQRDHAIELELENGILGLRNRVWA